MQRLLAFKPWWCLQELFKRPAWISMLLADLNASCLKPLIDEQLRLADWEPNVQHQAHLPQPVRTQPPSATATAAKGDSATLSTPEELLEQVSTKPPSATATAATSDSARPATPEELLEQVSARPPSAAAATATIADSTRPPTPEELLELRKLLFDLSFPCKPSAGARRPGLNTFNDPRSTMQKAVNDDRGDRIDLIAEGIILDFHAVAWPVPDLATRKAMARNLEA